VNLITKKQWTLSVKPVNVIDQLSWYSDKKLVVVINKIKQGNSKTQRE
jgi:hypothetical protein